MNRQKGKLSGRMLAAAMAILFAAGCCRPVSAASEYNVTAAGNAHIEMWHYSGNYWQLGNFEGYTTKITDAQLSGLANIQGYLTAYQWAEFKFILNGKILESIENGGSCEVVLSTALGSSSAYYDMSSLSVSLELPYVVVKVKPKFNLVTKVGYDSYISGLKKYIPLVDNGSGCNLYAIYKGSSSVGAADGYFNQNSLTETGSLKLHPSQIQSSAGTIKSGLSLDLGPSILSVSGHTVGNKTFVNAGAVGMDFKYYIFADIRSVEKENSSGTGGSAASSGGSSGSGDSSGTVTGVAENNYAIHRKY